MRDVKFVKEITALLVIDPYNDFISEGGKFWPRLKTLAEAGDTVTLEHWGSSGFGNTDLDLQLKKHGIHQLIVIGLIAHTCVEATVRYAFELATRSRW